jgi:hypothetical protein
LEYAKMIMLKFHYGTMKPLFGDRLKLLYTDTDSMYYEIRWPEDPIDFLNESPQKHVFDFSLVERYKDSPQKGKLGCFKYEAADNEDSIPGLDNEIVEAVFLAPKSYVKRMKIPKKDKELVIAGKGVPGAVLQREFGGNLEHFKDAVFNSQTRTATFNTMRSKHHIVKHCKVTKVVLSAENDKVFQVSPTQSRPLGHRLNREPVPACPEWDIEDDYNEVLAEARKMIAENSAPLIVPQEEEEEEWVEVDYSESEGGDDEPEDGDCDGED